MPIDPVLLKIGFLEIRWYGLIYALSFLVGSLIAVKLGKQRNIRKETIYDFFIYLIPAVVIGARLGHILGPDFSYYLNNPSRIFAIWRGGLSFFGGFFGAIITGIIFCKKRKINFFDLADILVIPLALALIFGRIANFINQELYGRITNLPWGVNFTVAEGKRHPTQLYESLKNLIIFIALWNLHKIKNLPRGFIFWTFILMYSFLRFFIEFLRDTSTFIIGLTRAQLIMIILFIISSIILSKLRKNIKTSAK